MDSDRVNEIKTNKLTQIATTHLAICDIIGTDDITTEWVQSVYGGSIKYFVKTTEYQQNKIKTYFGDKIKFYFGTTVNGLSYLSYDL